MRSDISSDAPNTFEWQEVCSSEVVNLWSHQKQFLERSINTVICDRMRQEVIAIISEHTNIADGYGFAKKTAIIYLHESFTHCASGGWYIMVVMRIGRHIISNRAGR